MDPAEQQQAQPDEKLNRMSFGDHLDELRKRLFKALIAIVICVFGLLPFKDGVGEVILAPYRALWGMRFNDWIEHLQEPETQADPTFGVRGQGYLDFCLENREAILAGNFLFKEAIKNEGGFQMPYQLTSISPLEDFWTFMMMSLILSLIIASPVVLYQGWSFIAAGLYKTERNVVYRVLPLSIGLMAAGVLFGYFVVVRYGLYFLVKLMSPDQVTAGFTMSLYFNLLFMLTAALGIVFQLPMVMLALTKVGIVTHKAWVKNWRYVLLGVFVTAAFFTPPDPFTQMMMAIPMVILFCFGLILTRNADRQRAKAMSKVDE